MSEVSKEKDSFKKRQNDAKKKQTGELPPDLDQDGKMINPHNPDFITKVPWYLGDSGPTLKHHNVQKVDHFLSLSESDQLVRSKLQERKQNAKNKAVVYRKGACKNCGAMTHKEKDCVERPRSSKKAAWKSGENIAADEVVLNMEEHGKVAYDAKRDQWQGYNPDEHKKTVERYERIEEERKKEARKAKEEKRLAAEAAKKAKQERKKLAKAATDKESEELGDKDKDGAIVNSDDSDSGSDYDSDEDNSDDENDDANDKEFLEKDEQAKDFQGRSARQGGIGGAQMKTTVRNLRIREDTPKYLYNLSLDSAHYDPKSHSMRMNPLPNENPEDLQYAGDNFVRHTGDALKLAQTQVLCWEMQSRGEDVDVLSSGTQAELVHKQFTEKKKALEEKRKKELLDKYGVSSSESDPTTSYLSDPRVRLGQTESFQQYTADGRPVKGPGVGGKGSSGVLTAQTKYDEDVYDHNHTSVWGSYYNLRTRQWGYACCHSTSRNCYCIGEKGKEINAKESNPLLEAKQMLEASSASSRTAKESKDNSSAEAAKKPSGKSRAVVNRSDVYGEYDPSKGIELDESKVRSAMDRIRQEQDRASTEEPATGKKRKSGKSGYNSMSAEVDLTPEDMEAYRRLKSQRADPMANISSDELLEYKPQ